MSDFTFYFRLGLEHILNWDATDHLLFLAALSSVYLLRAWKPVLILVTAFTIGHSLTLALSTYDLLRFNEGWVEFLIPLTIVGVSVRNLFSSATNKQDWVLYGMALLFGLIHGMGYANYLRFMIPAGDNIAIPLLSFNAGIEIAQVLVVLIFLILSQLAIKLRVTHRIWTTIISILTLLAGLWLCITRFPA